MPKKKRKKKKKGIEGDDELTHIDVIINPKGRTVVVVGFEYEGHQITGQNETLNDA